LWDGPILHVSRVDLKGFNPKNLLKLNMRVSLSINENIKKSVSVTSKGSGKTILQKSLGGLY
jgi:hypothetical protein